MLLVSFIYSSLSFFFLELEAIAVIPATAIVAPAIAIPNFLVFNDFLAVSCIVLFSSLPVVLTTSDSAITFSVFLISCFVVSFLTFSISCSFISLALSLSISSESILSVCSNSDFNSLISFLFKPSYINSNSLFSLLYLYSLY